MPKEIKIYGTIGSYKDQAGKVITGVELVDVIAQAENAGDEKEIHIIINSPGGLVDVGYAIYDYLISLKSKGKNITTIINGMCASIATIVALAGDKRQIVKGSKFLIHNPYLNNVTGDADQMREYAQTLDNVESGLAKFYSKITGIGSTALALIMKDDKEISAEKALELKFVTEIIDGTLNTELKNLQIIAAVKPTQIIQMKNIIDEAKKAIAVLNSLLAKGKNPEVKNLVMKTKDGKTVSMESLEVGSLCSMEDKPCISMTMEMEDGSVIKTDAEGKITEITPAPAAEETAAKVYENANLGDIIHNTKGEIMKSQEITLASGKVLKTDAEGKVIEVKDHAANILSPGDVIKLQKENDELKVTLAELKKIQSETTEKINMFSKLIGSDFVPGERKTLFNSTRQKVEKKDDISGDVRARRGERINAKK